VAELQEYNCEVDVYDPWVTAEESVHEYGISPVPTLNPATYDGIILAVAHNEFRAMGADGIRALGKSVHVLYDLKYVLAAESVDLRL
jgi:UDP-N-acetyl-D-galactosamine dehydrogenase